MKILPTQYNYTSYNKARVSKPCDSIPQQNSLNVRPQSIASQNVNFRGFLDLFRKEQKMISVEEARKILSDLKTTSPKSVNAIVEMARNTGFFNSKCLKSIIDQVVQLEKDEFDIQDIYDRVKIKFIKKEIFTDFVGKLYQIKQVGYPVGYIPEFFEGALSKEEDAKTIVDILNEAYKHRDELSYSNYIVDDEEIEEVFLDDPVKTKDMVKLLGRKDFINTFSMKLDNVQNNINKIGAIEFSHPLIQNLLELTNPTQSAKYKENEQKIKELKAKFNQTEDKTNLIKEINTLTDNNKNLIANSIKDPVDKVKLGHVFYKMRDDEKKLRYVLDSIRSNTKTGKHKFQKLISNAIITDSDGRVCKKLNFRNSRYLMNLYTADEYFNSTYDSLLQGINDYPYLKLDAVLYGAPMNLETRKQFQKLGINFDNWFRTDKNSVIQKEIKLKNEDRTKHVIRNLEADFSDSEFSSIPQSEVDKLTKAMAEKGFTLRDCNVAKYDNSGFIDGINTEIKLYKGENPIKFEDLPALFKVLSNIMEKDNFWTSKNSDETIDDAKNMLKNHILKMRYREMRSASQKIDSDIMQMTVRKVDMNDVEHALFLGNHAGCCTAVGSGCNQWTAPNYIICKLVSAIEVLDGKEPIGNTMCYIAEIDGKPSLVLDNIELQSKYQYNDEIRDAIFDCAKKMTEDIEKPNMPIYAGPNRHKVNMDDLPISDKDFRIIGSTSDGQVYLDFDADGHKIDGTEVFNSELYRIR